MPTPIKGATVAKTTADEAKAARGKSRVPVMALKKDGEEILLRFLTDHDGVYNAKTHPWIPTKAQPAEWTGDWPKSIARSICPRDAMFRVYDTAGNATDAFEEGFGVCYVHDHLKGIIDEKYKKDISIPHDQVYGLAVEREWVLDGGQKVGIRDKTIEWKTADGKTHTLPKIVIVSQKWPNFWHAVTATAYLEPKTICDKDFRVERVDNGKDNKCTVVNTTADHKPGTPSWKAYEAALAVMEFDLFAWLVEQATEDHYNKWFVPGAAPKGGYGRRSGEEDGGEDSGEQGGAAQAGNFSPMQPTVNPDQMSAFTDRLKNRGEPAAATP